MVQFPKCRIHAPTHDILKLIQLHASSLAGVAQVVVRIEHFSAVGVLVVDKVLHLAPGSLLAVDASGAALAHSSVDLGQLILVHFILEIFMAIPLRNDHFLKGIFIHALLQLTLPDPFEKHWCVQDVQLLKHRWEEPLDFENQLLVALYHLFIGEVLKLASLEVDDELDLVDILGEDYLLALLEFHSPGVLQFFDEVMDQQISGIVDGLHKFFELNLADLDEEQGSSLFVGGVEPVGAQLLYFVVLREFKVLHYLVTNSKISLSDLPSPLSFPFFP